MYYFPATLLESFRAFLQGKGYISSKEEMIERLLCVGKQNFTPNAYMQAGLEFEKLVQNPNISIPSILQPFPKAGNLANELNKAYVKGMQYQALHQAELNANIGIYGYSDWSNEQSIIELKTTRKIEMQRYIQSLQHKVLCIASGVLKIQYVVTDFETIQVETIQADANKLANWRFDVEQTAMQLVKFIDSNGIDNDNLRKVLIF